MIEETPVTVHVRQCVKLLNEHLQELPAKGVLSSSIEAVFELIDLPWDEGTEKDVDFREGYETCLLDIVGAVANEWGVELPRPEVR